MKPYRSIWLILSLIFWPGLALHLMTGGAGHLKKSELVEKQPAAAEVAAVEAPVPVPVPVPLPDPPIDYQEIQGELRRGESFELSLKRRQVPAGIRAQLIRAFADCLDYRHLRAGDHYSILLDEAADLFSATYESGPLNIYRVTRADNGFSSVRVPVPLEVRLVKLHGVMKSSLFAAFLDAGEGDKLVYAFADIFASKFDFNSEPRQDDQFSLMVEKYYKGEQFIGYGKILMARYEQRDQILAGYYYEPAPGEGTYFDPQGEELRTSFLRSPLPVARLTSKFTFQREHPILGGLRPHLGVDLAAPIGTPIMAACDGKVKFMGRNGGFGNQVILSHANGYRTHYAHLSRFKKGLHIGDRVKQKEIIGYVGSTGYSTGPHLDYRIDINGVFKDPFSLKFKPKSILKAEVLVKFSQATAGYEALLATPAEQPVLSVHNLTLTAADDITLL